MSHISRETQSIVCVSAQSKDTDKACFLCWQVANRLVERSSFSVESSRFWSMRTHCMQPVRWPRIASLEAALLVGVMLYYAEHAFLLILKRGTNTCCITAAFPLFGIQMYQKLGYQWASSLLAFLAVAMMPFPYIFFKYGKRIRGKSRFASAR